MTRPSLSETAKFDAKMTITHLLVHFLQDFFTSKSHQNLCTTCTNKYGGIYKKFPYNINSYSLNYSGKKIYIYILIISLSQFKLRRKSSSLSLNLENKNLYIGLNYSKKINNNHPLRFGKKAKTCTYGFLLLLCLVD